MPLAAPSRLLARSASALLSATLLGACAGGLRPLSGPNRPGATVPTPAPVVTGEDLAYLRGRDLLLPVVGVRARTLRSSFEDPRDGGARSHLAIDIMAPRGTPVLAVDDGRVWTVRSNNLGGLTVYTVDPADRFVFYYAHLDRYRDGLVDGMTLLKGDTLGFVGTTGNAPPDTPHLHFQLARIGPDHHWWTGAPIDPLPYLRDVEVAMAGRGDGVRAAAVHGGGDAAGSIVVPAVRTRRAQPTVPADTTLPDTSGRKAKPRRGH